MTLTATTRKTARTGVSAPFLLALGPAIAMGFARFAYALVLPAMKADLHWSYRAAGAMNTANAIGYLAGALLTPGSIRLWGEKRLFAGSFGATALLLIACGFTVSFPVLWLLRFVLGVSGAFVFITALSLAVTNRGPMAGGTAALVTTVGVGAGIALSGAAVPGLLAWAGRDAWHTAWVLLGAISLGFGAVLVRPLRGMANVPQSEARAPQRLAMFRPLWPGLTSYTLLGVGYITYMTFMIAFVQHQGGGAGAATAVWLLLGIAAMAWPLFWRKPIDTWPGGRVLAASTALVMLGTALPLFSAGRPALLLSALLMGAAFTPVAAITVLTRRAIPPEALSLGISVLTVLFAAGQAIGPYVSGALSDRYGLSAGLVESALVLFAATTVAAFQREPARHQMVES